MELFGMGTLFMRAIILAISQEQPDTISAGFITTVVAVGERRRNLPYRHRKQQSHDLVFVQKNGIANCIQKIKPHLWRGCHPTRQRSLGSGNCGIH
jgi:hypothetical protein